MEDLFSHAHQQANVWVADLMRHLGTEDPHRTLQALRAGLHAIRDRLNVDEAAKTSAQLPLLVRGIFFEGWDPQRKPPRINGKDEFLALVAQHYRPYDDRSGQEVLSGVVAVLGRHVSVGELGRIMRRLPEAVL